MYTHMYIFFIVLRPTHSIERTGSQSRMILLLGLQNHRKCESLLIKYVLRCDRWGERRRNYTYLSMSLTTSCGLDQPKLSLSYFYPRPPGTQSHKLLIPNCPPKAIIQKPTSTKSTRIN